MIQTAARKLFIFDVDGTLVNSEHLILDVQYEVFRQAGLTHPGREAGLQIVGLSLDVALGRLLGKSSAPELVEPYKAVFNSYRTRAHEVPRWDEPLYPGALDLLTAIRARPDAALGMATGKTLRGVRYILDRHGWDDWFDTLQTADDAPSKPHPGMIENAMQETGIGPAGTFMIGDSNHDMEMARAAGVTAIGVAWGFQPPDVLLASGAHVIARDYADLARLLA
jgi:phosphoglycolate phosphatase